MSGHKNFNELHDQVVADPERRARVERTSQEYDAILALADLRESLGMTQAQLAALLEVSQPNVSKLEHKGDVYLSTLSSYVAALGGKLELKAVFPTKPSALLCQERQMPNRKSINSSSPRTSSSTLWSSSRTRLRATRRLRKTYRSNASGRRKLLRR